MKQLETCSGRRFDSAHLHQKCIGLGVFCKKTSGVLLMGMTRFRQGKEYRSGQLDTESR
jgi:hypothetical protein